MEVLETRDLLSATLPGVAVPAYVANHGTGDMAPLLSSSPTGYTPEQIRHAYGFDQISFGEIPGDGSGTTIAIVDAYDDPNIAEDLHQFSQQFGLPDPVFTKVNQWGGTDYPSPDPTWITEIALDVQWAHAIAPGADILLVEAEDNTFANLMTAVDYARRASGVVAVSMSWSGDEFHGQTVYDSYFTTPDGHGGVTFLAASGDSGAPAGFPATSPNVVSVGGTTLYADSDGNYVRETGWSGSGGGISSVESRPAYQQGAVWPATTFRATPDVAYNSDPGTGFPVYDSYNNPSSTPWGKWGGTSAATPQWAGLIAIADQGRALAGNDSLDGATQALPSLYSVPASDFHDITSGTSTGQPSYSAKLGHDLVTGRGSPRADLLVGDLVNSVPAGAATHFSVTALGSSKAGTPLTITVKALDYLNRTVAGYLGTVHFTSSDSTAVALGMLPADYTFTEGDKGVHIFAGVRLATAGKRTIRVTDSAADSLFGTVSVTVTPAAADHLAFGQQPDNAATRVPVSPAITVKVLDAYNNLVTSDHSRVIRLSLGANPGGAVLLGTTTATVSGGKAAFGKVSVSQPGAGYALVCRSGALGTDVSASFSVLDDTVVEDFAKGHLKAYTVVGAAAPTASIAASASHHGWNGLRDGKGADWIYRDDSSVQVRQGDKLSVWVRLANGTDGRAYFGFGASAGGTLSLVASGSTGELLLEQNTGYGYRVIGSARKKWLSNRWYRLEVDWGTDGRIVGRVYDSDGTTWLQTVKAATTAIASGGIAFRAAGTTVSWDGVRVVPGGDSAAPAAAAVLAAAYEPPGTVRNGARDVYSSRLLRAFVDEVLGHDGVQSAFGRHAARDRAERT